MISFKNMGKLPAALATLSFCSLLSVLYFALSSTVVTRSLQIAQRFQLRDNDVLQLSLPPNVSRWHPHTDGQPNPTAMTDAVVSENLKSDNATVLNTSSAVPAVSSATSLPGSTSRRGTRHSVTEFESNAGLILTSQSLQRSVQKPRFKGVGLKSLFQLNEKNDNLTAVSLKKPSIKEQPAELNSDIPAATKCSDNICSQYLSPSDKSYFLRCQRMARIDRSTNQKAQCHFMDGRGRDPVALVSVPGAGNTWVRSLLEKASGICTGAIYCDIAIRNSGFIGEYIQSGSVSVVKTHTSDYQWKGERIEKRNREDALYGSAILLIRNPFDTFVSERNRVVTLRQLGGKAERGIYAPVPYGKLDSSHVHALDRDYFGNCSEWNDFLYGIGPRWKKTIDKWFLHSLGHPIMVVRYEDVKRDTVKEIKRILEFLKFSYDEQSISVRLAKEDSASFHRSHANSDFEHYTTEQKKYINSLLQDTIQLLIKYNAEHLFSLHEYLAEIL